MTSTVTAPDFHEVMLRRKEQEDDEQAQTERAINELVTSWERTFRDLIFEAHSRYMSIEDAGEWALKQMAEDY